MEEKERYELFGEYCIKDNNPDARCQLLNTYKAYVILNEQDKEIQQLKQQLAEKNKQLKQKIGNMKSTDFIKMCISCGFLVDAKIVNNQYKISFCIEQLEKVKENIKKVPITDYDLSGNFEKMYKQDAIRQIDNQIKQLKEKKDV